MLSISSSVNFSHFFKDSALPTFLSKSFQKESNAYILLFTFLLLFLLGFVLPLFRGCLGVVLPLPWGCLGVVFSPFTALVLPAGAPPLYPCSPPFLPFWYLLQFASS